MKPSGIGGQAVIEGIMMRNKNKYSIAVRKPDNEIEVVVKESRDLTEKHQWLNFPIIRGIVSFVDSLVTGISTINYSASFSFLVGSFSRYSYVSEMVWLTILAMGSVFFTL